ncbi:transcriptional regulator [Bacillus manliponensis]|uniref:Transcriptional regulator n=1 Tax=Bacillus manliponensis TaxID=574376 RepID=A0A073JXH8_9BACI|nr:TetR/AcrR family transcriptional regulator [Bacillus manliponensis]KEK18965.1 transcriptional regulator [Bacillus manliponensis]
MNEKKTDGKQSFIAEARRQQIIEAAIQTLDEIGYVKASLAQIAKRAGISTALISYHFADKNDLMNHLLMHLVENSTSYILEKTAQQTTAREQLHAFITASLAYQSTHPMRNTALVEIVFNARTPENVPYYKLGDEEEEPLISELKNILRTGQENGEFGTFHVSVMANMIQGAIGEYMLNTAIVQEVDLETYSNELVTIIDRTVKA